MIRAIIITIVFTCVYAMAYTQVNFVKNPNLEEYSLCPDNDSKIFLANSWRNASDSLLELSGAEYFNECGNSLLDKVLHVPDNSSFYQFPHSGKGMIGGHFYNDKSMPIPSPLPFNYRDNLQGHLVKPLTSGKIYCVSFWINGAEAAGYVHNKIGAYLDNGSINSIADTAGEEITSVIPQVYTNTIIEDTMNWVKIEGSFVATGNETHITIGNFFPNSAVSTKYPNYWNVFYTTSYYLIDDVSVVAIDSKANAGADRWVEQGKQTQIGPVEDSTARGMDCKWYHKGVLIDSGNVITVNANSIKYAVDTYIVVQTVCGNVTRDTMLLRTVGLGISEMSFENSFSVYPNPSNGNFTLTSLRGTNVIARNEAILAKVYDLLGRVVYQEPLHFSIKEATLKLNIPSGSYILELKDEAGNVQRERIVIK